MDTRYVQKELLILFDEFLEYLDKYNKTKLGKFDDDMEPTLMNFIRWLNF